MAFLLELGFHAATRRVAFADKETAQAALDGLRPKIGQRLFGENGDRERTYSFSSPAGDVVIDIEKIEFARIIIPAEHDRLLQEEVQKIEDHAIEFDVRHKRALAAA